MRPCCSAEQRLASELDYMVFRRILTPVQVRAPRPAPALRTSGAMRFWGGRQFSAVHCLCDSNACFDSSLASLSAQATHQMAA